MISKSQAIKLINLGLETGGDYAEIFIEDNQNHSIVIENGKILKTKSGHIRYKREPYKIKVLNTINFEKSLHYNPFAYISKKHPEKDIIKLVNTIMVNTKGEGNQSGEDFWVKAERLLLLAYIGYIYFESPYEEQNFITLLDMIDASETKEDDERRVRAEDLEKKEYSDEFKPVYSDEELEEIEAQEQEEQENSWINDDDIDFDEYEDYYEEK